jgi:hypothetical protein
MDVFICEVANKAKLTPTRFGAIAEIRNGGLVTSSGNRNKAQLVCWVAPGFFDDPSAPVFTTRTNKLTDVNKYICTATQTIEIVATGTAATTGTDVWESQVIDIDGVHSIRTTITITGYNTIIRGEWDPNLNQHLTYEEVLVDSTTAEAHPQFPSGVVHVSGTLYDYIDFDEIKCGWYLKTTVRLDSSITTTVNGTENHFWPAVLEYGPTAAPLQGEIKDPDAHNYGDTYNAAVLMDIRLKESYSGPCKATLTIGWVPTAPALATPTQMITDAFANEGIFARFSIPACLHYEVVFNELVGSNHPTHTDYHVKLFNAPATPLTDWPSTVVLPQFPQMYLGGYLSKTLTIYPPA